VSISSAAGAAAGFALWCTLGSLDLISGPEGTLRVGMLPSLLRLAGFLAGGAMAGAALEALLSRRRPGGAEALLPLFGTSILALPFLPFLPDWLPVLLPLAGPTRWLVWFVGLALVAWSVGDAGARPGREAPGRPTAMHQGLIVVAGVLLVGGAAMRLTGSSIYPGGDEPHYLVMAQSVWRDGDLRIEDNHARGDYYEYFGREIKPDYLVRGSDGEIYSIHPVGLPLVLAPVYGIGGYRAVTIFLTLVAAAAAALMWRLASRIVTTGAATFAWVAIAGSAPFLLNGFAVYPEILGALCSITVLATGLRFEPPGSRIWLAHGLALGALPWMSTKYAPMAGILALVSLWRIWRTGPGAPPLTDLRRLAAPEHHTAVLLRLRASLMVVAPFVASLACWFLFFYAYWGTFSPSAPYGTYNQTHLIHLRTGFLGLLFDQEYGLLPYAPVYLVAFTGLWSMWRAGGEPRRHAVEIAAAVLALMGTVGAFRIWWGGSAAPGRPLASGILLLGLPLAWQYGRAGCAPVRLASYRLLALIGIALAAMLVFAQQGLLIANERDGSSRLLEWLSPAWRLWAVVPSFIFHYPWTAAAFIAIWLVGAWGTFRLAERLWQMDPNRPSQSGRAGLTVMLASTAGVVAVSVVIQVGLRAVLQPDVALANRPRLALLDEFDATARPLAIAYDPLRRLAAADVPGLARLTARPDRPRPRQAIPLIFNGRFSLPAGEYEVELRSPRGLPAPDGDMTIALQVGRVGAPLQTWNVAFGEDERVWRKPFVLPVDAGFVGFRASPVLERLVSELRIVPLRVIDAHARPRTPQVLAAATYGPATVFFHSEEAWAEPGGFWVQGRSSVPITIASARSGLTLRLHSGPVRNTVTFEAPGWQERMDLEPGTDGKVTLPDRAGGTTVLTITTTDGFVPARTGGSSTDRRLLGSWVEIMDGV
jgi:hypothetical protein